MAAPGPTKANATPLPVMRRRSVRFALSAVAMAALALGPSACGGSGGSHSTTSTTKAPGY